MSGTGVIFFQVVFFTGLVLGIAYAVSVEMYGQETTRKLFRYAIIPGLAVGLAIGWLPVFLRVRMLSSLALLLFIAYLYTYFILWFFRRKKAGRLLLRIGRTVQHQLLLGGGLLQIAIAAIFTLMILDTSKVSPLQMPDLDPNALKEKLIFEWIFLVFYWSLALFSIGLGFGQLEFRESGVCNMHSFHAWHRIDSYYWKRLRLNTLVLQFKPGIPLITPRLISIVIPAEYEHAVNHILREKLINKELVSLEEPV
ncbi:MAG: hypothetical protein Fur0046_13140 [Cyanobacteria bacterium J069]|nr:MAG: hypothetical protein D6742_10410 [Cyanobacteria bacterium J069]